MAQAILFDLGQTTLTLTVIHALALWHGAGAAQPRSMIIRFVASTPLWALGKSLTLTALNLHLPPWLRAGLFPHHLTTTPLGSLVLGLSISFSVIRRCFPLALLGVVMRMGGGRFLGYVVAGLVNLDAMERAIVILVSAMPSAVTAVIFAAEADSTKISSHQSSRSPSASAWRCCRGCHNFRGFYWNNDGSKNRTRQRQGKFRHFMVVATVTDPSFSPRMDSIGAAAETAPNARLPVWHNGSAALP